MSPDLPSSPTPRPLPDLPGSVTLDQARDIVRPFGYKLVIVPADPAQPPPGFHP